MDSLFNEFNPTAGTTAGQAPAGEFDPNKKDDLFGEFNTSDPKPAIRNAQKVNPDEAAKNKMLSDKTGYPTAFVEADPKHVENLVKQDEVDKATTDFQATRNWLSDNYNAAVSQDSVKDLTTIEGNLNAIGRAAKGAFDPFRFLAAGLFEGAVAVGSAVNAGLDVLGVPGEERGRQIIQEGENFADLIAGSATTAAPSWAESGVRSAGQSIPGLLTGSLAVGLGLAGTQTFGQEYQKAKVAGTSTSKSLVYGALQGGVEVATELLPMHKLFGSLKIGDSLFKTLGKQILAEVGGEEVATALQDANEQMFLHPEKTFAQYLAERPSAALETALATVTGTALQTTVAHVSNKIAGNLSQANRAVKFGETLDTIQKQMKGSPLAERDPNAIASHFSAASQQSGFNGAYLSVDAVAELADKNEIAPIDMAENLGIRQDYEKEFMRGGDVYISPEKLAHLMMSDNWNIISQHIREGENTQTKKEAEHYQTTGLKEDIQKALEPEPEGFDVFHGTKHLFDVFKTAGTAFTGEGAQSFGPGIYTAEAENVARHYKALGVELDLGNLPADLQEKYGTRHQELTKELTSVLDKHSASMESIYQEKLTEWKKNFSQEPSPRQLADFRSDTYHTLQKEFADIYKGESNKLYQERNAIEESLYNELKKRSGYLYKTRILADKEKDFIQWDKPISEQPEKVQKLLKELGFQTINPADNGQGGIGADIYQGLFDYIRSQNLVGTQEEIEQTYDVSGLLPAEQEAFFTLMQKYSIEGIRYLDQQSRDGGSGGTYNYTVYDPMKLVILKRNDQAVVAQAEKDVGEVERELGIDGIFQTAADAAMNEKEYSFYLMHLKQAHDAAVDRQNEKLLKDANRKVSKEYKKLYKEESKVVRQGILSLPQYRALTYLKTDKLNKAALVTLIGDKAVAGLPKNEEGKTIYAKEGIDPSQLAEMVGFSSATDMLTALYMAKPLEEAVKETTDTIMKSKYPDLSNAKLRLQEALNSIAIDYHGEVLAEELHRLRELAALSKAERKALQKENASPKKERTPEQIAATKEKQKAAVQVRKIKLAVIKRAVKELLDATTVANVSPARFFKTSRDQAKLAAQHLKAGDLDKAVDAKFKQLVNFTMAQQSYKVKAKIVKEGKYLNKFNGNRPPKIGGKYLSQIKQVLANYNLGPKLSDKKKTRMLQFVKDQTAKGAIFTMPKELLADQKKHWGTMTVKEWDGMVDGVNNLEAQGRNEKQLNNLRTKVDFEHEKNVLVAQAASLPPTTRAAQNKVSEVERRRDKIAAKLASWDAGIRKVEFFVRILDGETIGPWWNATVKRYSQAQNEQLDMLAKDVQPIMEAINKWPEANRLRLKKPVFVKSLGKEYTYGQLLKLALNVGNRSNLKKVIEGHNNNAPNQQWTEQSIIDAMALLSPVEARWVQGVWDHLESIRPAVERVYEAENGQPAQKIEATSFVIGGVTVKGGYFPMQYKETPSHSTPLEAMQDPKIRASIFSGMTKERDTEFAGEVDLDLNGLINALEQGIHFITHYEAVRDINRLLSDTDIARTVTEKLGEEYLHELRDWSSAVASGGMTGGSNNVFASAANFFRSGLTMAVLGGNIITDFSQLLGITTSITVMGRSQKGNDFSAMRGVKAFTVGAFKYLKNPAQTIKQAVQLSGELRHRLGNTDRTLREQLKKLEGKNNLHAMWNRAMIYTLTGMQMYAVDVPTWVGAFNQGLSDGLETTRAIDYADNVLRTSQGTGHIKDLSALQREKGVMKALTTFSTWTFIQYNLQAELNQGAKKYPFKTFSKMMWLGVIPAMLSAFIHGNFGPGDDDDESYAAWMLKTLLGYNTGSVPIVGQYIASASQGYTFNITPLSQIPDKLDKAIGSVKDVINGEMDYKDVSNILTAVGIVGHIGGSYQAAKVFDTMNKAEEGDDVDWWEYATGPKY